MRRANLRLAGGERALAWLALGLVPRLTPREVQTLVDRLGSATAVLDASPASLRAAGVERTIVDAVQEAPALARREAERLAAVGAWVVDWSDAAYPERLRTIADPPQVLAARGTLTEADGLAVAIVGARRASEYGCRLAGEIAAGLARAGLTVVSGLATGIDAAAHRGALAAGGRTLAVLGTGIDRVYPPWHGRLADEITVSGACLTELPCGTPPLRHHFPRRNRLISGLTAGTVVIEAAAGSGSLITARLALEQGREVFAVPGPADSAAHHGSHALLREGAVLVTSAEEVVEELAPALLPRLTAARTAAAREGLGADEHRLLDAVGGESRHVDDVIRRAGLGAGAALELLLSLELRGLVHQLPGKRFRRAA